MSNFHVCEVNGPRCEMVNGSFLDYNRPPRTKDGRLACSHCKSDTDRGGVDAATDYVYPGLKHFLADRRAAQAATPTHHVVTPESVRAAKLAYPTRFTIRTWDALCVKADAVTSDVNARWGRSHLIADVLSKAARQIAFDATADYWAVPACALGRLTVTRDVIDGTMMYTIDASEV